MKRFQNILFVKSAENGDTALAQAVRTSGRNQARLTVFAPIEKIPDMSGHGLSATRTNAIKKTLLADSEAELERLAEPHRQSIHIDTKIVEGIPFLAIIRQVFQYGHDLVIKSAGGEPGPMSRFFSTTDMHLLRKCPCPVWLVKPGNTKGIRRIIAAVDFDEVGGDTKNTALNRQLMKIAISLAGREKAELHIVHAWHVVAESKIRSMQSGMSEEEIDRYIAGIKSRRTRLLGQLLDQAKSWIGSQVFDSVSIETHAIKGPTMQVVTELAQSIEADLLVMGTVGRTGIPGFLIGNTAESILNEIDCSVLAIKPEGFESPIERPAD